MDNIILPVRNRALCVCILVCFFISFLGLSGARAQGNYQNLFNQTTDIDDWDKSVATPGFSISNSSPIDGTRSLRSALISGASQVSYISKEMVSLTGPQFDTEGMDWEWSFVYRNNLGANPDNARPGNDVNLLESNNNSWRFWLFSNQDNVEDNNVKGYYVTQDNAGRIVLRFRNSQWDTRDMILSSALSHGSSYVIRISRVLYQGNTIYRMYVDPFSTTQQTATTYIGQAYLADAPRTYNRSTLVSVNKTANAGAFTWDNINMFKRTITLVDANSASNGITQGPLSYGMNNIVLFGWGINVIGTVNIQDMNIVHPGNTNPHGYFGDAAGDARIYRSLDNVYSQDDVQIGSAKFSGTDVQITGCNEAWNHLAGSTVYYFLVADFKETWGDASVPLQFRFVPNQSPAQVIQNTPQYWKYNEGTLNGASFPISKTFVWTGTAYPDPTDWNNKDNWDYASSVPGPNDHALIGSGSYAQPKIYSGNVTVGKLSVDNIANTTITVNAGASLTVATDITQRNSATVDRTLTLTGAGSITTGGLIAGNFTTPTYSGTRTTKIISTISSLTVTGDVTINSIANGTPKNNATVELQSGVMTIGGLVTVNGTGNTSTFTTAVSPQSGQLNIKGPGPFDLSATGTNTINFNGTSAIVNYNGTVPQVIHPVTYRTLEVNNTAGATLSSTVTVNKLVIGIDTANAVFNATTNVTNTVLEMYQNSRYVTSAPTFTALNTTSVLNSGTTIEFNGSSAQTVNASGENFQNIAVSGPGTKSFTASSSRALVMQGNYTVDGPVTYLTNISSIDINGNFEGGTSINSASKPITIAGNWNNTATGNIAGTVSYDGGSAQNAAAHVTYTTLNLTGAGTKTWYSTIPNTLVTVSGATNVSAPVAIGTNVIGVDLNGNLTGNVLPSFGSVPLNLAGSWTNTATGTIAGAVTYDGASAQTVAGAVTYTDLTFSQAGNKTVSRPSSGVFRVNGTLSYEHSGTTAYTNINSIDLNGDFGGTATINSGSIPITIAGNWNNTATGTIAGSVTYDGTGDQNLSAKVTYTTLNLTGSGTKNLYSNTSGGTLTVNGATNISAPVAAGSNVTLVDFNGNLTGNVLPSFGSVPVNISGSWTNTATGTVSSPVTYDGATAQTASAGVTYTDLSFTGAGNKTISRSGSGAFSVEGNLTYNQSGSTAYTNVTAIDINGDFLGAAPIASGSTPITIAGSWNNTATGTISGSVTYDGSTAQNISAKITYTTLNLTGSGIKNLYSNTAGGVLTVNGNTNVSAPVAAGSNVSSVDFNGDLTGNALPSFGSLPISISGNWTNTASGAIAGDVTYDGASTQTVSATVSYADLNLTAAGNKVISRASSGPFTVNGELNYSQGGTTTYSNISVIDINGNFSGSTFIGAGSTPVTISGNWNNTGTGTLTGAVTYDGASQSVGKINYADIAFNGSGTKTIAAGGNPVTVAGGLSVGSNVTLTTNGNITMLQDATNISSVEPLPAGAVLNGNFNVQIYVTGGDISYRGTRMFSSPINDAALATKTFKQLQNYMLITHPNNLEGFDPRGTNSSGVSTIVFYNEPAAPSVSAFTQLTDINAASPAGNGFLTFFRGNRNNPSTKLDPPFATPESVTLTYTGPLNTGPIVKNLSYTNHSNGYDGYNLVGNPYLSVIDWHAVNRTANVGNNITVVRRGDKVVSTYNSLTQTAVNGGSRYIQPGIGFYVQASAAGQSITFTENIKVRNNPPQRLLSTPDGGNVLGGGLIGDNVLMDGPPQSDNYTAPDFRRLILKIEDAANTTSEETAIVFMDGNVAESKLEDALYYAGGGLVTLGSLSSDEVPLAINMMPQVDRTSSIKLNVNATTSGTFKLNFTEFKDLQNYQVSLVDHYLNKTIDVVANPIYSFSIDRTNAATLGAARFEIIFEAPSVSLNSFTAEQVEQTSKLSWETSSEYQSVKFDLERSTDGTNFTKIGEVAGAGTSTSAHQYTFVDQNPVYGTNYYRFRQYNTANKIMVGPVVQLVFTPPPAMVLSSFTAEKEGTSARLKWTTSGEFSSARFDVERSADGSAFTKIGEVAGSGTTSQAVNYAFTDQNPLNGVNHYRLKHYNTAAETLLSNVVQLTFAAQAPVVFASFTAQKTGTASKLDWTTASEFQSLRFEIERSTDGTNFGKIGEVAASGTSSQPVSYTFTDQSPAYGANYYRIRHVNAANQSLYSQVVYLIHDAETPSMVLASFTGEKDGERAKLSWTTSSEFQSARFEIERSIDGLNFMVIGEVNGAGTSQQNNNYSFIDENPVNGINHYRLKNYDSNEHTLLSHTIQLSFDKPGVVFALLSAVKENGAGRLEWSTSSESRSRIFEVQHSTDGLNFTTIGSVNGAGTSAGTQQYSYLHTNPVIGLNHYRIRHYTTDNQATNSQVVQLDFDTLPAMVLNSFTATRTGDAARLNWVTSSEYLNERFDIERSADGLNYSKIGSVSGAGTSYSPKSYDFTDQQPLPGLNYYRLKQYSVNGQSTASEAVQVTFQVVSPVSIVSFAGTRQDYSSLLYWSTSSETGSLRFDMERSTDGVNFTTIGSVSGAGNSNQLKNYTFTDNRPAYTTNHYRLKHYAAGGQVTYSAIVQLTFDPPAAMTLSNFTGIRLNGTSQLSWSTLNEYQSARFDIERSADGIAYTVLGSVNGSGTSTQPHTYTYTDILPLHGKNYYRLRHYDTSGKTLLSSEVIIDFDIPGSTATAGAEVKIYPNPVAETLNISFNNTENHDLVLSVIEVQSGKKISSTNYSATNTISQNVSDLRTGIYMIEIRDVVTNKFLAKEKFIKQ